MTDLGSAPRSRAQSRSAKASSAETNSQIDPSQDLLQSLQAMRAGDFSVRMRGDYLGIEGKIADAFNEIAAANERMSQQLERVGQVVGREGQTRQRVNFAISSGSWADMESSIN